MQFNRFNLILGGLALSVAGTASADVLSGPIVNPTNGHSYYLLEQDTWTNSEAFAQSLGGHLVTINDAPEDEFVFQTFSSIVPGLNHLWIGYNDAEVEGQFVWSSGEVVTYTNSFFFTSGDYTHIIGSGFGSASGTWNLVQNSGGNAPTHGVVEVIPEPAAASLLGAGLLVTLLRRRHIPNLSRVRDASPCISLEDRSPRQTRNNY